MQWWTQAPNQSNGKPIHKQVETAYLHTDSLGYGWGMVLSEHLEARRFGSAEDEQLHTNWKELKAVRHAVESLLPQLAGRNFLMHEDHKAVCHSLTCLTSRSRVIIEELRRLRCLIDPNNINLRASYIRSAANVWVDKFSRHLDSTDWKLDRCSLRSSTRGLDDTLSIASRPHSTHYSPYKKLDGRTRRAKPCTPYTNIGLRLAQGGQDVQPPVAMLALASPCLVIMYKVVICHPGT
jgi:hypothetical protein